jgi:hypothetical protein
MKDALITIVNQLKGIAYEDLTPAEVTILKTATMTLGWKYTVTREDGYGKIILEKN